MRLYLLALNPTDSVTDGFLPAAAALGLDVTVLTDHAEPHHRAYAEREFRPRLVECDVRDFRAVISTISQLDAPDAVFSNSDHLQTQTALAAEYFGLPAKDWKAALRAKDKGLLRRHLALAGLDTVRSVELPPGADPAGLDVPFPCVLKPREGVASEDVSLVADPAELALRRAEIGARRGDAVLVAEEFLAGELHTLETLGDTRTRHVLGGFRTRLSPPPDFIEEALVFVPAHPAEVTAQVLAQLDALGVGLGACHTEFVVQPDGRARIIEVNYRAIGDQCDLMLARLLDLPLFELVLRAHLGERLPADLGPRTDRRARNEAVLADRPGTLTAAPGPYDAEADGVTLSYRPTRAVGERHELHRTNRDYLGVVWAVGPDQRRVDDAVAGFIASGRWEITS
ncbi:MULTISPECIES: ATP-grasp domain-containing protein [Kitasatospora]|uniref:Putative siderophore biosynthesis protein n=1 Tax=Kitasatospora setae (strain ATCC 33774 / DSM 43861 / JCM 3304 / KCC A-0304 / NBRC 14216 / KM-6054) TaxID=452652 RepID=E4N7B8_KITSK|nr:MULTISPECIES: ATP-grasp domain-containing protein [Kitasatospora]BAJ27099.1 putative siderophore biosynthesis protein [Kitasatospora setae KM-6054]